jgi:hypothetical protein
VRGPIWSGVWLGLGYLFKGAIELVAAETARLRNCPDRDRSRAGLHRHQYIQRQRVFLASRGAITPEELFKRRLDERDSGLMVIDTRSSLDVNATPCTIPGAQWILPERSIAVVRIPSDREIVLYCS